MDVLEAKQYVGMAENCRKGRWVDGDERKGDGSRGGGKFWLCLPRKRKCITERKCV